MRRCSTQIDHLIADNQSRTRPIRCLENTEPHESPVERQHGRLDRAVFYE
jgi:hypothetical protein